MSVNRITEVQTVEGIVSLTRKEHAIMCQLPMYSSTRKYLFAPPVHLWDGQPIQVQELSNNFKRIRGPLDVIRDIVIAVEL